jgi:cell division protein FtsQ
MKAKRKIHKSSIVWNITAALLLCSAIALALYISSGKMKPSFPIKNIVFSGNRHLTDSELKALTGLHAKESLVTLSHKKLAQALLTSPWIRSVSIRKEFPETVSVSITEAVPFVLLNMNGTLFLVDEKGKLLEELKGNLMPFLPIITGDPFNKREAFSEALNLITSMNDTGFSSGREHIEVIASRPEELTAIIDGTVIKVGVGEYREKLQRLVELKDEIKKRNIPVDYVDVRFANRVIVKPINEMIK